MIMLDKTAIQQLLNNALNNKAMRTNTLVRDIPKIKLLEATYRFFNSSSDRANSIMKVMGFSSAEISEYEFIIIGVRANYYLINRS